MEPPPNELLMSAGKKTVTFSQHLETETEKGKKIHQQERKEDEKDLSQRHAHRDPRPNQRHH
jgi:hypothetical protein